MGITGGVMRVRILFWFDVEDYITPESDVALGRLVDIFDQYEAKATFKLVGEKVRGLQRRGQADRNQADGRPGWSPAVPGDEVSGNTRDREPGWSPAVPGGGSGILARLSMHDIGYHTDYHSRPPTIPEYLLGCDWEEGIAEFERREHGGLATLREAFGRTPSCYGQPGGAWAPHVYPVLRQWGIPVYLDAGPWVSLNGEPHRYCGILNLLGLEHTLSIGISRGASAVQDRLAQVQEIVSRLRHTGGVVSLYAHECEFVTSEFWDAVNFRDGRDLPREQWKPAAPVSPEESEERYRVMGTFLDTLASIPEVELIVASEANVLCSDRARGHSFTAQQIVDLCQPMPDGIRHQHVDGIWLSPGEILSLAVHLIAAKVSSGQWPAQLPFVYVDGPSSSPHVEVHDHALRQEDLFGTCLYERAAMDLHSRVPSEIQIGRTWLSPADLLATIGAVLPKWLHGDPVDAPVIEGRLASAEYVADHVSWGWTIFPPGFDGDALLSAASLQAWTLKPAPFA
jgi:peptidoglycan/xylan/chitin deacetylase (PgdA/CDA1 family)